MYFFSMMETSQNDLNRTDEIAMILQIPTGNENKLSIMANSGLTIKKHIHK